MLCSFFFVNAPFVLSFPLDLVRKYIHNNNKSEQVQVVPVSIAHIEGGGWLVDDSYSYLIDSLFL